jgi:hypothetical protein
LSGAGGRRPLLLSHLAVRILFRHLHRRDTARVVDQLGDPTAAGDREQTQFSFARLLLQVG